MAKNNKSGFGIIGLGRFGMALARMLGEADQEVVVIDSDESKLRKVRRYAEDAFVVGQLTREALEETGINECATVIICISKVDVSVLTTQIMLEMGVPRVIAKADSMEHGLILEKIGADVVYPETETAAKLVTVLLESKAIDLMRLNDNYVVSEIRVPESFHKSKLSDLEVEKYGLKMVAIEVEPEKTLIEFDPDCRMSRGEAIVVVGKFSDVERFEREIIS